MVKKQTENINNQNLEKQLDALARLLTGVKEKDKCVAVWIYDGKLFVASNNKSPEYARRYLKNLQKFINDQSSKNYEKLLRRAVRQISFIDQGTSLMGNLANNSMESLFSNSSVGTEGDSEDLLVNFRTRIRENNYSCQPNWDELQKIVEKFFQESKAWKRGRERRFLTPWHDTKEIAEAIIKEELDNDILKAIKESNIEFVGGRHEFRVGVDGVAHITQLHAEMKIIDKLSELEKKNGYIGVSRLFEEEREMRYIGLAKKTCPYCQAVIDILNDEDYLLSTYENESHGKKYDAWIKPKIMKGRGKEVEKRKEEIINEVKENKIQTTSQLPKEKDKADVNAIKILRDLQKPELEVKDEQFQEFWTLNNWTNIHFSFVPELISQWQSHHFSPQQVQDWINIGLQPTESNFAVWLRDKVQVAPEELLNDGTINLVDLKEQFQEHQSKLQVQSHQEIPPK